MIYLVTSGNYSDYGVDAVFDDRKMAEEYIARFQDKEPYVKKMRIEEHPLNPAIPQLRQGLDLYRIIMQRNGNVDCAERMDTPDEFESTYRIWGRDVLNKTVWARDIQHAVKIVNERRVMLISEGKF